MIDLAKTIMQERIQWGVEIVKDEAKRQGLPFSEALFIKGIESGISMFIQKERAYRG